MANYYSTCASACAPVRPLARSAPLAALSRARARARAASREPTATRLRGGSLLKITLNHDESTARAPSLRTLPPSPSLFLCFRFRLCVGTRVPRRAGFQAGSEIAISRHRQVMHRSRASPYLPYPLLPAKLSTAPMKRHFRHKRSRDGLQLQRDGRP